LTHRNTSQDTAVSAWSGPRRCLRSATATALQAEPSRSERGSGRGHLPERYTLSRSLVPATHGLTYKLKHVRTCDPHVVCRPCGVRQCLAYARKTKRRTGGHEIVARPRSPTGHAPFSTADKTRPTSAHRTNASIRVTCCVRGLHRACVHRVHPRHNVSAVPTHPAAVSLTAPIAAAHARR
jgi:hypothetical protein